MTPPKRSKKQITADTNTMNHLADILISFSPIQLDVISARKLADNCVTRMVEEYRRACRQNLIVRGVLK